jgi:hypothetical protein
MNIKQQAFHWKRFSLVYKSWVFRMTSLSDRDLKNKVPKNNLGIYSPYCDRSQWSRGDGIQNFWIILNEGWFDMMWED